MENTYADIFSLYSDDGRITPHMLNRLLINTDSILSQQERFEIISEIGEGVDF
jgi:hypothetical protein